MKEGDGERGGERKVQWGSLLTHFILFPGVICPNSDELLRTATYAVSVSSGLSVAEPKYSFPADFAMEFS